MLWFVVDVLTLRKLGLSRPFRYLLLVIFIGCLIAGVIYASVVFSALSQRSRDPHVHTQHFN
jgi:hypothetical protein